MENQAILIGIDEAGRGPLVGDLVIGFVAGYRNDLRTLEERGVRDSKELTRDQREMLFIEICRYSIAVFVSYIPPYIVDRYRLNRLTAERIVYLLKLFSKFIPSENLALEIFVDDVKGFKSYLEKQAKIIFRNRLDSFIMEEKADKKYPVVSAASIVAKYFRDRNIYCLKKLLGEIGSGYPSDPRTIEWIKEIHSIYSEPPSVIRRSWATLRKISPNWYHDYKRGRSILDYMGRKG